MTLNTILISQNIRQVGPEKAIYEGSVSQEKIKSYIYKGNLSDYGEIKNQIYNYFDQKIDMNFDNYHPEIDPTTSYTLFIYRKTDILNESFNFETNPQPELNPLIYGHSNDIIAVVTYSLVGSIKTIYFYSNKKLTKIFIGEIEREMNEDSKILIGDLEID